ncbi:MAG TPA: hypothetical protein VGQ22_09800 [Steroidobacteraceae bacterium]|nr:hypothetical protein [Steroidobacteraceae bacterium]
MRWIRALLKAIALTLVGCIALAVLLYLVVVLVNWNDRKPSPVAERMMQEYQSRPPVADAENGYVYAMGFAAAPEQDPLQMGVLRVAWMKEIGERNARTNRLDADLSADPQGNSYQVSRDPLIEAFRGACKPGGFGCVEAFAGGDEIYDLWIAANSELLSRYSELTTRRAWVELVPIDPAAPFPSYAQIMDGQRLLLLHARRLAMQGDYDAARRVLESDLQFWRLVFESADTLITKMIATVALVRHFEHGNLILRGLDPRAAARVMPAEWRTPINENERSMRRCMVGEWVFTSGLSRSLIPVFRAEAAMGEGSPSRTAVAFLGGPLYQPQDSMNRYADYYSRVGELLDAPLARYEEAGDATRELAASTAKRAWPPGSLYNLLGSWIRSRGISDVSNYGARVADVEGVRRAALAAVTLRAAKVETAGVADALKASEWRNPYTGRPFEWSATDTAIRFQGLAAGERGVHLLYY